MIEIVRDNKQEVLTISEHNQMVIEEELLPFHLKFNRINDV